MWIKSDAAALKSGSHAVVHCRGDVSYLAALFCLVWFSFLLSHAWVKASWTDLAIGGAHTVSAFYPQAPELEPRTLYSYVSPGENKLDIQSWEPSHQPHSQL